MAPVFSYVSQLVPRPKSFEETFGIYSVLRAPKCMRTSDIYQLHKLGGPNLRYISVACAAATYRTALTTVTCRPKWISQLEICAKRYLPFTQLVKRNLTPSHWDSDSLALNLKHAYNGFPNKPQWAEGGAVLSTKLLKLNNNRPVPPGCDFLI